MVSTLRENGYSGWFVLEQDTILTDEAAADDAAADVAVSMSFLRRICRPAVV